MCGGVLYAVHGRMIEATASVGREVFHTVDEMSFLGILLSARKRGGELEYCT